MGTSHGRSDRMQPSSDKWASLAADPWNTQNREVRDKDTQQTKPEVQIMYLEPLSGGSRYLVS